MQYGGTSVKYPLRCRVPQGSVLCPISYFLYMSPLSGIVEKLNLNYHFYAEDLKLCLSLKPTVLSDRHLAISNNESPES